MLVKLIVLTLEIFSHEDRNRSVAVRNRLELGAMRRLNDRFNIECFFYPLFVFHGIPNHTPVFLLYTSQLVPEFQLDQELGSVFVKKHNIRLSSPLFTFESTKKWLI